VPGFWALWVRDHGKWGCFQMTSLRDQHVPVHPDGMTIQTPIHQRAVGEAMVALGLQGLTHLRQQGSAKVILPRVGGVPEVVFLNTSGGLTGGDRLTYETLLDAGVRAVATTQTAERAYRSSSGLARVTVTHHVGAGGWLDWLPQETILFDDCAVERRTIVDLGPDAGCLLLEAVVLGRAAMGETLGRVRFSDWREVRQGGRLRLVEPLALTDAALQTGVAGLDGARAFASIAMVAQGAEDALGPVRAVLTIGTASAFDGKVMVRIMAADGWPMRQQIAAVLGVLRRAALPRVWQI
jgi:urease accessory protein